MNNKHFQKMITSIILFLSLFLLINCSKETERIQIGAILDLTGPIAPYGQWSKNGLELAIQEIDQRVSGIGKRIELLIEDGKSEPATAVSSFKKLIDIDKVQVVVITTGSSSVLAIAPIAEAKKVILFTPAASSPDITNAGDYIFRNRLSGTFEVEEMARVAYNQLHIDITGILYVNNDFGLSYKDIFLNMFNIMGGNITLVNNYEQGETDYRTNLLKIKNAVNINSIYLIGYAEECGRILKQSKEYGLDILWLSTIGIESEEVINIAGNAANGVIYTAPTYDYSDPSKKDFEKKYFEKYKEHSNLYAANSYDALMIIWSAIELVGYDSKKIKDYIYSVKNYPGVGGITTFDKNGDVIKPIKIKTIRGGKFQDYIY